MPNTTYYLWVFPADSSYNHWLISSVSVTLSGSYGNPASPSAGDGFFGSGVGITLSGGSGGASYTVKTSCAGHTETLQTKGTGTYLSWTPAVALYAPLVTDASSAPATITVETFYGSASIGTRSTTLTLSFRAEDVAPTPGEGWFSHAPYNPDKGSGIAKYVEGISRARVSFDSTKVSTRYGAAISAFSLRCGGVTVSAAPYETPILTGESTVTVAVRDSRGFTAGESFTVTPLAYAAPGLSQVSVFRCDESGNADEEGRWFSAKATAVCSGLEGDNGYAMQLRYKTASGSYGSATPLDSGTARIFGPVDQDAIYDVKIEIGDTVGNDGEVVRRLLGRQWAMRFRPGGQGVAFGMSPQGDRRLELPGGWALRIGDTELNEKNVLSFTKKLTFSAAGSTSISDTRLTADHRVTAAQFFDNSNNAVDSALADLSWSTAEGVCAVTISTVYGAGSVELSFTYAP